MSTEEKDVLFATLNESRDNWQKLYMEVSVELEKLKAAIEAHHSKVADDRCLLDDDTLYAAANLLPPDRRVGDKFEMLKNCARYIDRRCESGYWPSYEELRKALEICYFEIMQHNADGNYITSHQFMSEDLYALIYPGKKPRES